MSLPFTQRFPDAEQNFGLFDAIIFSPDRSRILTYVVNGASDSEGYREGAHIWDNASRTAIAYDATFSSELWGGLTDTLEGFKPHAISNNGTLWGVDWGSTPLADGIDQQYVLCTWPNYFADAKEQIATPGAITGDISLFDMPDDTERLIVQADNGGSLVTAPNWYVYTPSTDTFLTVAPPTPPVGYTYAPYSYPLFQDPVQDLFGDIWLQATALDGSSNKAIVLWRIVEYGDNPDTINDVQAVTSLPSYPFKSQSRFTPNGFVVACGAGSGTACRYLVRLTGLNSNSWSIAQTVDYGSVLDSGAILPLPAAHASDSIWVRDYRDLDLGETGEIRAVTEINASTLAEIRTVNLDDWIVEVPDGADRELIYAIDYDTPALLCLYSQTRNDPSNDLDTPNSISWRYWTSDGGGAGNTDDSVRLRVWAYSLDGHDYYVLRVGDSATLVYDLTTGQWAHWQSPSRYNWRAHIGTNWVGMRGSTFDRGFGTDVVGGDDSSGQLWVLDPLAGMDDNQITGDPEDFARMVVGGIPLDGRNVSPCGAATLECSLGNPKSDGATVKLEISDDLGHTWTDCGEVEIAADSFDAVVEWRSLGTMRRPGRIFRLTDSGATTRLGSLSIR